MSRSGRLRNSDDVVYVEKKRPRNRWQVPVLGREISLQTASREHENDNSGEAAFTTIAIMTKKTKKNFYGVAVGLQVGIYDSWDACRPLVSKQAC